MGSIVMARQKRTVVAGERKSYVTIRSQIQT